MMFSAVDDKFQKYYSGSQLIGDDYSQKEIESWFQDEKDAYAGLGAANRADYQYVYHAWNEVHGFSYLANRRYNHAVGFGSAYGHEFFPIAEMLDRITIIDASEKFEVNNIRNVPTIFKNANALGNISEPDASVDLLTCFGALHHVPNVTYVLQEFGRILKDDGIALIREPIVNMGDWRRVRVGLTPRERGIPVHIMEAAMEKAGLKILKRIPCDFPVVSRLAKLLRLRAPYNSKLIVYIDSFLSQLTYWNAKYDRAGFFGKLCPCSVFWVCKKVPNT